VARSRNIKPTFFTNEYLAELSPLARLLFIGLWCQADREGRLQDRPKRLKIDILPYDNCDVDILLDDLQKSRGDFIKRYEVEGNKYIQIINFSKHQNPHKKEVASTIPEYKPDSALYKHHARTVQESNKDVENTEEEHYTNSASTETEITLPDTGTEQERELHTTSHADSLLLIPDSLLPINTISSTDVDTIAHYPYEEIVKLFNSICTSLPKVKQLSEGRKKKIKARWNDIKELNGFKQLFEKSQSSSFLTGVSTKWKATFDWLIENDSNYVKVLEGNYDNDSPTTPTSPPKSEKSNRGNFEQREYQKEYYSDFFSNTKGGISIE
jgi:hypothetical protein